MRLSDLSARPLGKCSLILSAVLLAGAGCTTNLNRAITREKPNAVDQYLASGANVNEADKNGETPLIHAAQYGDLALMKKLVERGALVNTVDHEGDSALSCLASGETYKNDCVAFLLDKGADASKVNYKGQTPLVLAAMRDCQAADADSQAQLLALLLKAGANPDLAGPHGEIPLHLASYAGQPDKALECLVHATKEPNALSSSGYSAYSEAARGDRRGAELCLAGFGFEPQKLAPVQPPTGQWPPVLDLSFPINARAQDVYGDFLLARGKPAEALSSYRISAASFDAAIAEYRQIVDQYTAALKKEKDARKGRIAGTIALNVLGGGLAVATGVGFAAIPKRVPNNIDEYEDELDRDHSELNALTKEQLELQAKIRTQPAPPGNS